MLTEVKAYSSWRSAPTLPLSVNGRPETDLIQIRDIQGLNPVQASITTSPFGSTDGSSYVGGSVVSRNIVLKIHPNPNWDDWTFEGLRQLLYSYFMPKRATRLVFYSDNMDTVEISGIVESVEVNPFSKDPELIISILCPDPYFTSLNPKVITGQSTFPAGVTVDIDYKGTIEAGVKVKVSSSILPDPATIGIQIGNPVLTFFIVDAVINPSTYFEMSSLPMRKYVQNVDASTGVITNLLSKVHVTEGSQWPIFQPGINEFSVVSEAGTQDWELTYFERFGGL